MGLPQICAQTWMECNTQISVTGKIFLPTVDLQGREGGEGEAVQCCAHTVTDCIALPNLLPGNTPFIDHRWEEDLKPSQKSTFLNLHTSIQQYHCGLDPGNIQRGRSIQKRFQDYLLRLRVSLRAAVLHTGVSSSCIDTSLKHWVVQLSESGKQPNITIKFRNRKGSRKPHTGHPPNVSSAAGPLSGQSAQH